MNQQVLALKGLISQQNEDVQKLYNEHLEKFNTMFVSLDNSGFI